MPLMFSGGVCCEVLPFADGAVLLAGTGVVAGLLAGAAAAFFFDVSALVESVVASVPLCAASETAAFFSLVAVPVSVWSAEPDDPRLLDRAGCHATEDQQHRCE
jgi:hypothetical protein